MKLFCKHNWEIKVDIVHPSPYDMISEKGQNLSVSSVPYNFFVRKHIVIMACIKCGKVNTTETVSSKA